MSNLINHNLTGEKIQQLLAAVGAGSEDDTMPDANAPQHDWRQPHYFDNDQLKKLNDFAQKAAQNCADKFTQLYRSNFSVTITSVSQHFAAEFLTAGGSQNDYYLAFEAETRTFGAVGILCRAAILWVTQLLGDSKSVENSDRDLSQLEQSLLFDIASNIVEALSNSYDDYDLRPAKEIVKGRMPLEVDGTEEICKIAFSVRKADSENSSEAYFLIFCDKLQAVAGQKVQTGESLSAQNISKAMFNHIQDVPVTVTVRLARTMFNFQEIMSLQVDDILQFDKKVNEPAELIVEGETVLRGKLAKSDGKHAMVVTEMCSPK